MAMEHVHTFLYVPNFRMWSTVSLLTGTERIHLVINGAHSTICAWCSSSLLLMTFAGRQHNTVVVLTTMYTILWC